MQQLNSADYWQGVCGLAGIKHSAPFSGISVFRARSIDEVVWGNSSIVPPHVIELSGLDVVKKYRSSREVSVLLGDCCGKTLEAYVAHGETLGRLTYHSALSLEAGRKGLKVVGVYGTGNCTLALPVAVFGIALLGSVSKRIEARLDEFQIIYIFPEAATDKLLSPAAIARVA